MSLFGQETSFPVARTEERLKSKRISRKMETFEQLFNSFFAPRKTKCLLWCGSMLGQAWYGPEDKKADESDGRKKGTRMEYLPIIHGNDKTNRLKRPERGPFLL